MLAVVIMNWKYYIMKLIYVKSTAEPKNYTALHSLLEKKQVQGE